MSDTANSVTAREPNPADQRREDQVAFGEYVKAHGGNPPGDLGDNGADEYDE
jgi:hypothetical protein